MVPYSLVQIYLPVLIVGIQKRKNIENLV